MILVWHKILPRVPYIPYMVLQPWVHGIRLNVCQCHTYHIWFGNHGYIGLGSTCVHRTCATDAIYGAATMGYDGYMGLSSTCVSAASRPLHDGVVLVNRNCQ